MLDYQTLHNRCRRRSLEPGDRFDQAACFLQRTVLQEWFDKRKLSRKERDWISGLRQELTEPWE